MTRARPPAAQLKKESEPDSMSHLTYPEAVIAGLPRGVTGLFQVSGPGRTVVIPARARGLTSPSRKEPGLAVSPAAARRAGTRSGDQGCTLGNFLAGTGAYDLPIVAKERA